MPPKIGKPVDYDPFKNLDVNPANAAPVSATSLGLPEFPMPNKRTPEIVSAPLGASGSFAPFLGVMSTTDPKALQDIMMKQIPGSQPGVDPEGNPFIIVENKPYYLNKPGLSGTDVVGFIGDLAKFMPAGKLAQLGLTVGGRGAIAAVGTGVTGSASQLASQSMGSTQPFNVPQVALESAFGAGGQVVGDLLGSYIRNNRPVTDQLGQFTPEFNAALKAAGINISDFGAGGQQSIIDAYKQLGGKFAREAKNVTSGANIADVNFPLTRGQATGDIAQLAEEEAMRNAARGSFAQKILARFDEKQKVEVLKDLEAKQKAFASGQITTSPTEVGGRIYESIRNKQQELKLGYKSAYEAVDPTALRILSESVDPLESRVMATLKERVVDPTLTPASRNAIDEIRAIIPKTGKANVTDISLKSIETTRKKLNELYKAGANDTDRGNVSAIIKEFDNWLDDSITNGLVRGDINQLGKLKEARALYAQYRTTFPQGNTGKLADADAAKNIRTIVEKDLQPSEVMNLLYGKSAIGEAQSSVRTVQRLKKMFGADSNDFKQFQEAAFVRLTRDSQGNMLPASKIVRTIDELIMGKGSGLTRELFSADQIREITKLRSDLNKLVVPIEAQNPSRSGYEGARAVISVLNKMGFTGAAGNLASGDIASAGLMGATSLASQVKPVLSARRATNMISPSPQGLLPKGTGTAIGGSLGTGFYGLLGN
jgi:hypothetical protein